MEPPRPSFDLAPSAKEALDSIISQIPGAPVIALTWTVGAKVGTPDGGWQTLDPHWGVGAYDERSFPEVLRITKIDGISFAYGFESDHLLDGATVHCRNGQFHVEKRA